MAEASTIATLTRQIERLRTLLRIGTALSAEKNRPRLLESILLEAKALCNADGGTLYLRTDDDHLEFAIMRTDTLGIALGGTTGKPIALPRIPLYDATTGAPNLNNVATWAANQRRAVNIRDAYDEADQFDFSGTERFDRLNGYRSTSFLTIPMVDSEDRVIAVLQLLNARDDTGAVVAFGAADQEIVEALASQGAVALENALLLEQQRALLESFIKMIASAIDAKSPYTGGHCERVPILTQLLARAACEAQSGPFASFTLDDDEWYELEIAAWLHDCGKIVTPVHVMDKATKLETIADRIDCVRARFATAELELEVERLRAVHERGVAPEQAAEDHAAALTALRDDLQFLERANIGGEFLPPAAQERIRTIGARKVCQGETTRPMLTQEEIDNLTISRGTLTDHERLVINGHMVQTLRMLSALPFPRNLARVPEYAAGHHETMDGRGYPRGIFAGDMSIPARMMAIADVFEALTAQDRPYKPGKTLSESMRIMGEMKRHNHLDPDLLDLFVTSGVYRTYAEQFLPPALLDEVDEAAILAIEPKPFELADEAVRGARWADFLPQYRAQAQRQIAPWVPRRPAGLSRGAPGPSGGGRDESRK